MVYGKINNSCYKCEKRCIGCHSTCTDYKLFKEELNKINKAREDYIKSLPRRMSRKYIAV